MAQVAQIAVCALLAGAPKPFDDAAFSRARQSAREAISQVHINRDDAPANDEPDSEGTLPSDCVVDQEDAEGDVDIELGPFALAGAPCSKCDANRAAADLTGAEARHTRPTAILRC